MLDSIFSMKYEVKSLPESERWWEREVVRTWKVKGNIYQQKVVDLLSSVSICVCSCEIAGKQITMLVIFPPAPPSSLVAYAEMEDLAYKNDGGWVERELCLQCSHFHDGSVYTNWVDIEVQERWCWWKKKRIWKNKYMNK